MMGTGKSLFRRDAETNARDGRAPRRVRRQSPGQWSVVRGLSSAVGETK
jgi:hypothetical protein